MEHRIILQNRDQYIKAVRGYLNICPENLWPGEFPLCEEKLQIFTTLDYWLNGSLSTRYL
jgi:hypothetical protein